MLIELIKIYGIICQRALLTEIFVVFSAITGQLDRVVHGMSADEILNACDETSSVSVISGNEGGLANPAVHFFRGLKHRNIAAIRHAAQVGHLL